MTQISDSIVDELVINEDDFYGWKVLRLHPLLLRAIYALGFKEPTAIQEACIPPIAHRGKDVIGAAETGSGKTLAFGLPILQRLLEEREKATRKAGNNFSNINYSFPESWLRALILTPTRELALQVCGHIKDAAQFSGIRIVPVVGGMSMEKQERLLKRRPEIIVGTPGRLWELMSEDHEHLIQLHALSFFVLDEADRMIENGHFRELQFIIDMLPGGNKFAEEYSQLEEVHETNETLPRKRRQTLVFSATVAVPASFRQKLKHRSMKSKATSNGVNSVEVLSQRAGMRTDAVIVNLTCSSILAHKLEECFTECKEEDKDAYLYYLLTIHGYGRTIVFCTSIAALRHIYSLLHTLKIDVWTLHAQMQQRARLKAIDRFRGNDHGTLVATDVAARGLDIPGVRTVVHYQLPHSAEIYVHRSGRTARAFADGCSVALVCPADRSKFASLCKHFSKESIRRFPFDMSYMPEVIKRVSLARQIDKIMRTDSQEMAKRSWFQRMAESVELYVEKGESEEETAISCRRRKSSNLNLKKLQKELDEHLARPLQPKTFSSRYLSGAGVTPVLQKQLEILAQKNVLDAPISKIQKKRKLVVIGQDCIEPLQALRCAGNEISVGTGARKGMLGRKINARSKGGTVFNGAKKKR